MLKASQLCYRKGKKKLIDEISLTFLPGQLSAILGPNGAGKTTLLKALAGIWKPTSGLVQWNGLHLHQQGRRAISQTISMVPQHYPVSFDFRVSDLVAMGLYARGERQRSNSSRVENALREVDAWHLKDRIVTHLSHGERQRVYIARALATESPILLLDEPTASLDIRHQLEIWVLLRDLATQGKTVVVSLHDLEAAQHFCDRVAVLNGGCCVADGTPDEALSDEVLERIFGVRRSTGSCSFALT